LRVSPGTVLQRGASVVRLLGPLGHVPSQGLFIRDTIIGLHNDLLFVGAARQ